MSKSRNDCGWECCPSGFIEHVKQYRYLKEVTKDTEYPETFWDYWWWEFKSLIGLHNYKGDE